MPVSPELKLQLQKLTQSSFQISVDQQGNWWRRGVKASSFGEASKPLRKIGV